MSELDKLRSKFYYYKKYNKENEVYTDPEFTLDYFVYRLSTEPCIYCGIHDDLGFDRINKSKGYTNDNTVVACKRCIYGRSYGKVAHKTMLKIGDLIKSDREEMEDN